VFKKGYRELWSLQVLTKTSTMTKKLQLHKLLLFTMKVSFIYFLFTIVLIGIVNANNIAAQVLDKKVTIDLQNVTLRKVLERLSRETEAKFLYHSQLVSSAEKVSLSVTEERLAAVLEKILTPFQITFEAEGNQIVLTRQKIGFLEEGFRPETSENSVSAIQVTGSVKDDKGLPLPGVSIAVKGSTNGTTTDANGSYSISVDDGNAVLIFSFIGFLSKEVVVGTQTEINISLAPDLRMLDEVVVIGYGEAKKSDLTGSVTTVPVGDIKKLALTSIDQSLQGRAAGVQITQNSSAPGGSTTIRIRGGNSIQGDNEPLYVIDGIPFKNDGAGSGASFNVLSTLNPTDIESMTVLKDASSTAIYGSRGANGVIIITTKRGKSGRSTVNLESYYGIQNVRRKYPLLNATEFAMLANEAAANEGAATLPYTQSQIDAFGEGTDWQEEILRSAPISNYQLTMTGGDETTQYAIAGGYFKQEGIILNSDFDRASFRINLDRKLSDKIKIGNSLSVNRTRANQARTDGDLAGPGQVVMNALQLPATYSIRDAEGKFTLINPGFNADNPVALAHDSKNLTKALRVFGNIFGQYEIIEGLSLKMSLGVDGIVQKQDSYLPKSVVSGAAVGGRGAISNNESFTWLNENLLEYTTSFNEIHKINALLGYTMQENVTENVTASSRNFVNDNLQTNSLEVGSIPLTPTSSVGEWGLRSYLARVNYTLNEKYLLTASFRMDGSSRFGSNTRYGYFPSAAFAWKIKEESFLTDVKFLSDLKLRTSYGLTGNQDGIGNYPSYSLLGVQNYVIGGVISTGISPTQIPNPNLSWESTSQVDLGLDFGFMEDRITMTADVYMKKTKDLLLNVTVPSSSGFSSALQNLGSLENKGIELSITSNNLEGGTFTWVTNLNFAANRSKVTDLGGASQIFAGNVANIAQNINSGIIKVGEPLGSIYGFVTDGLYQTAEEIAAISDGVFTKKLGDRKYKDLSGDGIIDDRDRTIIGRAQPKFIGGITNTFAFKGIELSLFFQGVYGSDILNANRFELEYLNGVTNQDRDMLNRWTPSNTNTDIPRATTARPPNRISTRQVEDGSYLRMKNVQLAYNIPTSILSAKKIKSVRVYFTLQNYLTWTNYSGYDPEVNRFGQDSRSQGFDYGSYPAAKTFLFGINIGL
jgi:TonB-linked SusC/RagA family outer membrane protein